VQDGEDGIIVKLSDGTIGGYVLEELLEASKIMSGNSDLVWFPI